MKLYLNLFLFLVSVTPAVVHAGGSVSGGADYQPDMKAWFTSNDPQAEVKICVEADPVFLSQTSHTLGDLSQLALKSFQTWAAYYEKIGGDLRAQNPTDWNTCPINGELRKGFRIATHASVLPACDGTQDLTIYFGNDNADLAARKKKYDFPFAFSELSEALDLGRAQAAWSKGIMWIANPKSIDNQKSVPLWTNYGGAPLEMVLLHEMGHVFGTEHIAGTVMDGKIGQKLLEVTDITRSLTTRAQFNPVYLSIDQNAYLVFQPEVGIETDLVPHLESCNSADDGCMDRNQHAYSTIFRDLTSVDLLGASFNSHFSKPAAPLSRELPEYRDLLALTPFSLSLSGDQIKTQLAFHPISVLNNTPAGNVFQDGCRKFTHNQVSIFGSLESPDGSRPPKDLVMNINTNFNPIELVDEHLDETNDYCQFYLEKGIPCSILSTQYEQ